MLGSTAPWSAPGVAFELLPGGEESGTGAYSFEVAPDGGADPPLLFGELFGTDYRTQQLLEVRLLFKIGFQRIWAKMDWSLPESCLMHRC